MQRMVDLSEYLKPDIRPLLTDHTSFSSGPSQTYPQRAYRNPLDRLVKFLDDRHGENWAIWEFRAEGTGYPDELVYNRIRHYPWPDHHPPPFQLVPMIMASMRNWLSGNNLDADRSVAVDDYESKLASKVLHALKDKKDKRVIVVHCKAGKGRSGTMACSYLISECGWTPEQALARFTERRMRPSFGPGVSIPSQLRWISYVDRWTKGGKKYVDRQIEVVEIHAWGLRNGVKLAVEGYVDQGKKIKVFHTFTKKERQIVEGNAPGGSGMMDMVYEMAGYGPEATTEEKESTGNGGTTGGSSNLKTSPVDNITLPGTDSNQISAKKSPKLISPISRTPSTIPTKSKTSSDPSSTLPPDNNTDPEPGGMAVIFKPHKPIYLPNSDVNVTIERRNRAPKSVGLTMVTAVAHVWFNSFFEGNGPEQDGTPDDAGVFEIEWDKLDGIKGSSQKGSRAADRIAVVWRAIPPESGGRVIVVDEPRIDTQVPQMQPADWKGGNNEDPEKEKHLGLRVESPESEDVSKASSVIEEVFVNESKGKEVDDGFEGLRSDASAEEDKRQDGTIQRREGDDQRLDKDALEAYAEKLPKSEDTKTQGS